MYSHQKKSATSGNADILGNNDNANINLYMGCEKSVKNWCVSCCSLTLTL